MNPSFSSLALHERWQHVQVSNLQPPWHEMTQRVHAEILRGVEEIRGAEAAEHLRRCGLECLHEVLDAGEVGALRDRVLDGLRQPLLGMAVQVGRQVLGWEGNFFVDDYLILRINFPYEVARQASAQAENPGIGRLSPSVREVFKARKVIDPVFDPKSYHRDHPPAAWAHGPHLDSWAGHSKGGWNLWWAIGDVPAEAGMVLYPELAEADLPVEPRTLYLQAGYPLPKPTFIPLKAGEMLVFDPEILHGTHLNLSGHTRVAVSMRLNTAKPCFDPGCFYAREFWRRSDDIEQGRDAVLHLRREEHLGSSGAPAVMQQPAPGRVCADARFDAAFRTLTVALDSLDPSQQRWLLQAGGQQLMLLRNGAGWAAFDAACPHYGLDLTDGGCDEQRLYCPGCAVAFDRCTGRSASTLLSLRRYEVELCGSELRIRLAT